MVRNPSYFEDASLDLNIVWKRRAQDEVHPPTCLVFANGSIMVSEPISVSWSKKNAASRADGNSIDDDADSGISQLLTVQSSAPAELVYSQAYRGVAPAQNHSAQGVVPAPLTAIPNLNSLPGAAVQLYLDSTVMFANMG